MSFQLPAVQKLCKDACQLLMLEQAAKTNVVLVVGIQVFIIMHSLGGCS